MRYCSTVFAGIFILFFGAGGGVQAQTGPEISVSSGISLATARMQRTNLPQAFRANSDPASATTLRVSWPIRAAWSVDVYQHMAGLASGIRFDSTPKLGRQRFGSGFFPAHLLLTGLALRNTTLWQISPSFTLSGSLGIAFGWTPRPYRLGAFSLFPSSWPASQPPQPSQPVVYWNARQLHRSTWLLSLEALLRYELPKRRCVLLTVGYYAGMRRLWEVYSTRAAYLEPDRVTVREGSFVIPNRGSHVVAQLGYGWPLRPLAAATPRWHTPRYSLPLSSPGASGEDDLLEEEE